MRGRFPSNWELSTARAQQVVNYLIQQGVPPERLAAVGMGNTIRLTRRIIPTPTAATAGSS